MGKTAFIFPGQGAQYVGMGKELANTYPEAMAIFDRANEALGFDMKQLCFEGEGGDINETRLTQPAILTMSVAVLEVLKAKGLSFDAVAGLSLGEYSALVASGAMGFEDAVKLVLKRGTYMQEAVPVGVGKMVAVIGSDEETVMNACKQGEEQGVVEIANLNCPGQIVIGGKNEAVDQAVDVLKEAGVKRVLPLKVSAPFHTAMLQPAADRLNVDLKEISFTEPSHPVVVNVSGNYRKNDETFESLLTAQVVSSVRWEDSIRQLIADGYDTFVEVGPGKSLSGFMKKIDRSMTFMNIECPETLSSALEVLSK